MNKILLTFMFGIFLLSLISVGALSEEQYFFSGVSSSGGGINQSLIELQGTGVARWLSGGVGNSITFIKQYSEETIVTTDTINVGLWCNKSGSDGGDQVKIDFGVYDCEGSSTCAGTPVEICTGADIDCDSTSIIYSTGSCSSLSNITIETDNYLGIRLTADENKVPAQNMLHYNDSGSTLHSHMNITEHVAAAGGIKRNIFTLRGIYSFNLYSGGDFCILI